MYSTLYMMSTFILAYLPLHLSFSLSLSLSVEFCQSARREQKAQSSYYFIKQYLVSWGTSWGT